MKNHYKLLFYFIVLLILSTACTQQKPTNDLTFRIEILYEHTLLMEDYSTPDMLNTLNLDINKLTNTENLNSHEKINELANAYNIEVSGSIENQIIILENKMEKMMNEWNELQNIQNEQ